MSVNRKLSTFGAIKLSLNVQKCNEFQEKYQICVKQPTMWFLSAKALLFLFPAYFKGRPCHICMDYVDIYIFRKIGQKTCKPLLKISHKANRPYSDLESSVLTVWPLTPYSVIGTSVLETAYCSGHIEFN